MSARVAQVSCTYHPSLRFRRFGSLGGSAGHFPLFVARPVPSPGCQPAPRTTRMAAYFLTAAAMSLPALGMLRCCCRRRVFTAASASLSTRPSGALIIDTDCALDDLATLALAAATGTSLQLVTTVNGLAPPGHGHELVRQHGQSASLGSAPARLLRLLGARLPALVSSAPPRKKPVHPAPSHCPGCSSEPPPKPPIAPHLTIQVRRMLDALEMRSVPAVA